MTFCIEIQSIKTNCVECFAALRCNTGVRSEGITQEIDSGEREREREKYKQTSGETVTQIDGYTDTATDR